MAAAPEESAHIFCIGTPDDITIDSYIEEIKSWSPIKKEDSLMGCGINVLAFIGFITIEDGNDLLTNLVYSGTSLDMLSTFMRQQFDYLDNYTKTYESFLRKPYERAQRGFNPVDTIKRNDILKNIADGMESGCMTILKFDLNPDPIDCVPENFRVGHTVIGFKDRANQLYIIDPQKKQVFKIQEFITGERVDENGTISVIPDNLAGSIKGVAYFKKTGGGGGKKNSTKCRKSTKRTKRRKSTKRTKSTKRRKTKKQI